MLFHRFRKLKEEGVLVKSYMSSTYTNIQLTMRFVTTVEQKQGMVITPSVCQKRQSGAP